MVGGSLTLEGGTITGHTTTAQGGGVFVKNGTLTVKDGAVITGNTVAEGGGVYATGSSTVNIYGGEISHNTATSTVLPAVYTEKFPTCQPTARLYTEIRQKVRISPHRRAEEPTGERCLKRPCRTEQLLCLPTR